MASPELRPFRQVVLHWHTIRSVPFPQRAVMSQPGPNSHRIFLPPSLPNWMPTAQASLYRVRLSPAPTCAGLPPFWSQFAGVYPRPETEPSQSRIWPEDPDTPSPSHGVVARRLLNSGPRLLPHVWSVSDNNHHDDAVRALPANEFNSSPPDAEGVRRSEQRRQNPEDSPPPPRGEVPTAHHAHPSHLPQAP